MKFKCNLKTKLKTNILNNLIYKVTGDPDLFKNNNTFLKLSKRSYSL